jgi:hypothetical protein
MAIQPFVAPASLVNLSWPLLQPDELLEIGAREARPGREAVVRLWLTEGCPRAFERRPATWEQIRAWLASRLEICPKDITIVGSARIGFSMKSKTWGRQFSDQSDLDIAVVSATLFDVVVETFRLWLNEYDTGAVTPRDTTERMYWNANKVFGKTNIPRGFYDSNKLPTLDRYPVAQKITNAMWLLKSKLDRTPEAPRVRRASARIYRDWASLIARVSLNLRTAACAAAG